MWRKIPMLLSFLLICGPAISPAHALALGIGVTPGKMEFSVLPGGKVQQALYIINQSDEESVFKVYIEGGHEEWFKITPDEFTLPPQQSRSVEIAVAPPFTATESYDVAICFLDITSAQRARLDKYVKTRLKE